MIIAGAGLSAALPGVVAAHTDLPVIGVPLTSSTSVAGGLDALLSIAQMPPGVPVACVGVDNARNAAVLAARILERVIARYTRPEIGAVWTDEARFGAMRDVEVAAAEALDGPTAEDLDAIRARDLHGRRDQRAREDPRPRHGGVRRRAGGVAPGPRGAGSTTG